MKYLFFVIFLVLILSVNGFSQSNLTQDQVRRYANELGVPYEALQRLVDSHRVQTGLTNPNASSAQVLTTREINFMHQSNLLVIGSFYRTNAVIQWVDGRTVRLGPIDGSSNFSVDASFMVDIPNGTPVDALIGVRAGQWGGQELFLVEIVVAN